MSVWTWVAVLFWMGLGAAIALAAVALWKGSELQRIGMLPWTNGFAAWLGRECKVDGVPMVVVAVSHKGAIAVRYVDDESGRHARWIPKEEVPEKVRWS